MKHEARASFNTTQALFTTHYQRRIYQTLIAGFLNATSNPRPATSTDKSAAALSRFLNHYAWNAHHLIRIVRTAIHKRVWDTYVACRGRKPTFEIMLDLTTLEKTGISPNLDSRGVTCYTRFV